jgi:hypothetical protein
MGYGAGVLFDMSFDRNSINLSDRSPYVRKSDLGVKIRGKKMFTDSICVPVEQVKMESAMSSATVKSYDKEPIGYLLINPDTISDTLKDWIKKYGGKGKYEGKGVKLTNIEIGDISQYQSTIYSGGYARSPFPSDGLMDVEVTITLYFEANGRSEATEVTVEEMVYFDKGTEGYIPFGRGLPQEYDGISVETAYTLLDDLWNEDEPEADDL